MHGNPENDVSNTQSVPITTPHNDPISFHIPATLKIKIALKRNSSVHFHTPRKVCHAASAKTCSDNVHAWSECREKISCTDNSCGCIQDLSH